jgi:hypothetical protein
LKTIENILREQIQELSKLLELKDQRIRELEALRTIPGQLITNTPIVSIPSQWGVGNLGTTVSTAANTDQYCPLVVSLGVSK